MPLIFTFVSLLALVALLLATVRGSDRGRYASKPVASLAFIAVALSGGAASPDATGYCTWIVIGLVLGAVGDVALMFSSARAFLLGLVSFLLGHVVYVIAFHHVVPVADWFGLFALVPACAAGLVLVWLAPHLGAMRIPVIAYVMIITSMVIGALAVLGADPSRLPKSAVRPLFLGALLFYVSDLAVARQRFVHSSVRNRLWGLPAYYVGQLLLAWSAVQAGSI